MLLFSFTPPTSVFVSLLWMLSESEKLQARITGTVVTE